MNTDSNNSLVFRQFCMVFACGVALMLLAEFSGCDTPRQAPVPSAGQAGPARVETISVALRDLAQTIEMPATVEGFEKADLYAKVGGYLDTITVDIGDRVEKGQTLATLSIPEMDKELQRLAAAVTSAEAHVKQSRASITQSHARVKSAEAALEEAKTQHAEKEAQRKLKQAAHDRIKELVERRSLLAKKLDEARFELEATQAAVRSVEARVRTADAMVEASKADVEKAILDVDSATADVAVAVADLEKTKAMIKYGTITAPFTGVITKRTVDAGAFIQPAEGNSAAKPLLTVARIDTVRVMLQLPMPEVRFLNKQDHAVLDRIDVLPGERFEGEVARFASALDRSSRTMRVEIDLPNPMERLLPGYYGYVRLLLEEFPKTPTVPSSALMTDAEGSFVYVIENNTCRRRAVTTNYTDGSIVGLASGLEGDEQVVKAGGGQLADGQQVDAVNESE